MNSQNKEVIIINNEEDSISLSEIESSINNSEKEKRKKINELQSITNKRMTLSKISHFKNLNEKKKVKKKPLTSWHKVRHFMYKMVDNIYTHILILFLAVYSLYHEDLMLVAFPKDVDVPFEHTTEAVFFFFLLELIILIISKKKFIGSFYFYLDIISLISLIPEVHLIWYPLITLLSGSSDKIQEVLANSHLAKTSRASQAGSKASRYLRLLRLTNFLKVIRVAKVLDAHNQLEINIEEKKKKKKIGKFLYEKGRSRTIFNDERELVDKMVALSMKYNLDFNKNEKNSTNLKRKKTINFRESHTTMINRKDHINNNIPNDNNQIVPLNSDKSLLHNKTMKNNLQRDDLINTKRLSMSRSSLKSEIIQGIRNSMKQENINYNENEEIDLNVNNYDTINNNFDNLKIINSAPHKLLKMFDAQLPIEENAKRLSIYYTDVKPYVENILINYRQKKRRGDEFENSSSEDEFMDEFEEELFREKIDKLKHNQSNNINNFHVQIEMIKEEILVGVEEEPKNKKSEEELLKEVSHKSNSKLENKLSQGIIHQVVIIIMILLITMPMIEFDFLFELIYPDEMRPERHIHCLDTIFYFMNYSLYDNSYLKVLNSSIDHCFYSKTFMKDSIILPEASKFLYLNFNESYTFYDLQNSTKFFDNLNMTNFTLLEMEGLDEYLGRYRYHFDYEKGIYEVDDYNNITFAYDNSEYDKISAITGILKSTYVAVILILSAYFFSKDVNDFIIIPLDKIFTKLNINLNNIEIFDKKDPDEDDEDDEVLHNHLKTIEDLFNNKNNLNLETKNKQKSTKIKNSLETIYIDSSLHRMLKMISMMIGKIGFLVIPNSNLNKDLKMNIKIPQIKFEGCSLILKISNTDELFNIHLESAHILLSKVYSVFHSLGVVFLGEPNLTDDHCKIIWKKNKKEWMIKTKKYSEDLIFKRKNKILNLQEDFSNSDIDEENYDSHYVDLCLLTGLKFIHVLLHDLQETFRILRESNVRINLMMTHGELFQGFIGNDNFLSENYYSESLEESFSILDNFNNIDNDIGNDIDNDINEEEIKFKNYKISPENKNSFLPSLFIHENIYPLISDEYNKLIFPYEFCQIKNKVIIIHRHYFNYNFSNKNIIDNFHSNKLNLHHIFNQRNNFEKILTIDKEFLKNYLIHDDIYLGIISELTPLIRTMINLSFFTLNNSEFTKSFNMIRDLKNLMIETKCLNDPVLFNKIAQIEKLLENNENKDKEKFIRKID